MLVHNLSSLGFSSFSLQVDDPYSRLDPNQKVMRIRCRQLEHNPGMYLCPEPLSWLFEMLDPEFLSNHPALPLCRPSTRLLCSH